MPTFAIALFPCHAALAVHRLDARQSDQIVTATDDVALKTIMANQISAVMHHLFPSAGHIAIAAATITDAREKLATSANCSLEKQITYRNPILGTTTFNLNTKP